MAKRKSAANVPTQTAAEAPKKPGRKSKYDPSMCETIIELGKRGRSKTQCAAHIEISQATSAAI